MPNILVYFRLTTHYFSSTKKRGAKRKSIGPKLFLKIKIENFYQKQQLPSKKSLPARLLSVAKNSAL